MIDHIVGTPSPSWKRTQVFLVIFFWLWRITRGDARGPRILWIRALNRRLRYFTPWQIIVSTLTVVYAMRNADKLFGLGAPEPLARLYAPSYYRATWINTGLDAGFATAMNIRQKWLRDICSIIFSVYYVIFANEADEKLRRFRAAPTIEMLRVTWEKTSHPLLQLLSLKKSVAIRRKIILPRPDSSPYSRPITIYLFYSPRPESNPSKDPLIALSSERNLIFDIPGGGFISMGPEHHEDRLRSWAVQTGKPVISIEYGKAPEYPYPFAVDEVFDAYRIIVESNGKIIGMAGEDLNVVISGDSAGGCLATGCTVKIIEHNLLMSDPSLPYPTPVSLPPAPLPLPAAITLSYPALDFNFTSWMTPSHLKVLREETEADEHRLHTRSPTLLRTRSSTVFYASDDDGGCEGWAKGLRGAKDHLSHANPLAMVNEERKPSSLVRKKSWRDTFGMGMTPITGSLAARRPKLRHPYSQRTTGPIDFADSSSEDGDEYEHEENRPIEARIRWHQSSASSVTALPLLDHVQSSSTTLGSKGPHSREVLNTGAQARLAAAVLRANMEVAKKRKRAASDRKNAPIGMRLTMTSRSGYFQDRIISPTMMRAMAILYIGPHLNPDFASDYHISPILTPPQLLAKFPPLLLQCGEKDPLVDDTIIFAGRVREAKRQRREEIRKALATRCDDMDNAERQRLEDELESIDVDSDENWLQMQIFSGWSHGYLQMPTLMPEAQVAINDLATWIEGVFATVTPTDSRVPSSLTSSQTSDTEVRPSSTFFSRILPWPFRNNSGPAGGDTVRTRLDCVSHLRISSPDENRAGPLGCRPEADFEDCVTIVPKKVHRESHMDDEKTRREKIRKGVATYCCTSESDADFNLASDDKGPIIETNKAIRSPPRTPKAIVRTGTPGKTNVVGVGGQIISESELMRRRRLMDSHIFVSE